MKLTWKSLEAASLTDPAVHGDGYHLRYRRRKNGTYAELRFKAGPGAWKPYPLGKVPTAHELEMAPGWALRALTRTDPFTVEEALEPLRKKARDLLAKLQAGCDPRGPAAGDSLGAIVERFLAATAAAVRPRTQVERVRHLREDWAPLHSRPAGAITKREVANQLEEIARKRSPIAANRARSTLSALFAWAFGKGLVDDNPVLGTGKEPEPNGRDRELSLDELRRIWAAAPGEPDESCDYATIVRLLMLTGQRREEVGGMRWAELDLDAAMWSLPPERTKNGKPHLVPLSDHAVEMLRACERRDREHVFGQAKAGYSGWSRSKGRLDHRLPGMASWCLHDLRHAWATHVDELISAPHVVEAALNHISGTKAGVAGRYNKAAYLAERRAAMHRWADYLLEAPGKVVRLRA